MIFHGNKKRILLFRIVLIVLIPIILYFAWRFFFSGRGVSVSFLTEEKEDRRRLNELDFDVLFGAPHFNGFEVYRYQDGKFRESPNRYDSSPAGEESMKYLDWIIAKDDSIKTYREMREKYGQVNRIKESGGLVYVLFDGYLIDKGSDNYKVDRLVAIDPKMEKYRIEEIEVPALEFVYEFEVWGESKFFVTETESYVGETGLFECILYEWKNGNISRYSLFQNSIPFRIEAIYIKNGVLYFSYFDQNKQEIVRAVRLEDRVVIAEIPMPAGSEIEYLYYSGDRLKIYSNKARESIIVTETSADLELKDQYSLEADGFWNIKKVLEYQNETYVVLSTEEVSAATIYKQKDKKLEKLLAFARRNDDLFYYNTYFFSGKQGNYLGR